MNRVFLGVVCVLSFAVLLKADGSKRFFLQKCSSESDCGQGQCCSRYLIVGKYCFPKRRLYQSCNFLQWHGCDCADGLECRIYKQIGKLKFYRCLESEGSGVGEM